MQGPVRLVRSDALSDYRFLEAIYERVEGRTYLCIDRVRFRGKTGAVLTFYNPPMHQVGTGWLYGYDVALDRVLAERSELEFLLLNGGNDPVHSGGDLKESLQKLEDSLARKEILEMQGASPEDVWGLFSWGEERLRKGLVLYGKIREAAKSLRVVGVAGGGMRFGGSAEILLMADYLVGDSRSGMCFSEAMIGIIPGWAGIGRVLTKAGLGTARFMTETARGIKASDLLATGIYNAVVDLPLVFPLRAKTGGVTDGDKRRYAAELDVHDHKTGRLMLSAGLEMATCPVEMIPRVLRGERKTLSATARLDREVARRMDPHNYAHLWHRPLREVMGEVERFGRPLAPQSIEALEMLFEGCEFRSFDEGSFVERELEADAALYRDPRFREGLSAMLEGRIPDFRLPRVVGEMQEKIVVTNMDPYLLSKGAVS